MSKRAADEEAATSESKVQRVGDDTGEAEPPTITCTAENFWSVQIEAIYRRRNPHKLAAVPELLKKYAGKEAILYAKICKTYDLDPKKLYADEKAWEEYEQDVLQDGNEEPAATSSSSAPPASGEAGGVSVPSLFGGSGSAGGGGGVSVPSLFGIGSTIINNNLISISISSGEGPLGSTPSSVPNLFGNSAPLFGSTAAATGKTKAQKRKGRVEEDDEDDDDDDDDDSEEDSDGGKRGSKAPAPAAETKSDAGECKTQ